MIRHSKIFIILFFLLGGFVSEAQQLAFPGAEGYGRFATGGRGDGTSGRVVEVTNLEDDLDNPPEGSLRWAFSQAIETIHDPILGDIPRKMPLTVVFRVGGVIHLKGELRVNRSNLTIAGQTAPGDGICIADATVNFSASKNVIVRYLRSRPGDKLGLETSAFRIENGGNFIIDHCSFSWAIEETTHFSSNENTTVQWCIISESLYNSIHKKGPRGYATQWGGEYASYHHNLLADHNSRMPRINGSNSNDIEALVDYRNNVNYNWASSGAFYGGEWEGTGGKGFCHTNVVNNYFIPGPATSSSHYFARPSYNRDGVPLSGYGKWYFNGNVMEGSEEKTNNNWLGVDGSNVGGIDNIRSDDQFVKSDGVLEDYDAYTESASDALESVLNYAGAILPKRDSIDARVVAEARGEIPVVRYTHITNDGQVTPEKGVNSGIIDTQANLVPTEEQDTVTAWDVYNTSTDALVDTDHDGIPDTWEMEHSLNPEDITDGRLIAENGYSNLENYLNSMDIATASAKIELNNEFKVYPNPANDIIQFQSERKITTISLFDMNGRMLETESNQDGIYRLNVKKYKPGIYFVKATSGSKEIAYRKIIKQ